MPSRLPLLQSTSGQPPRCAIPVKSSAAGERNRRAPNGPEFRSEIRHSGHLMLPRGKKRLGNCRTSGEQRSEQPDVRLCRWHHAGRQRRGDRIRGPSARTHIAPLICLSNSTARMRRHPQPCKVTSTLKTAKQWDDGRHYVGGGLRCAVGRPGHRLRATAHFYAVMPLSPSNRVGSADGGTTVPRFGRERSGEELRDRRIIRFGPLEIGCVGGALHQDQLGVRDQG